MPFDEKFEIADQETAKLIKKEAGLDLLTEASPPMADAFLAEAKSAAEAFVSPGTERWDVKTLQDAPERDQVGKGPHVRDGKWLVVDTTIGEMRNIPRPPNMPKPATRYSNEKRTGPVEMTIWRLAATIFAVKSESDGDLHLALRDGSDENTTMIAESPRAEDAYIDRAGNNPFHAAIADARAEIEKKLQAHAGAMELVGTPGGEFLAKPAFATGTAEDAGRLGTTLTLDMALQNGIAFRTIIEPVRVELTGVGFFDSVHGQTGVSKKNGIELHPVLAVKWL